MLTNSSNNIPAPHDWGVILNWRAIFIYPCLLLLTAIIFEYSGFDIWWDSHFYNFHQHVWPYRHHWLFDTILHSGGQMFDKFVILLWLIIFITVHFKTSLFRYRKITRYFFCASAVGPIIVGILKSTTHIYTPWDLVIFNGKMPYIRIFDAVPPDAPVGFAFPAGHASGGYCFLSLYFVLHQICPRQMKYGLWVGLLLGIIYGAGQQVRGAHFPSHDLFTLVICWYSALLVYLLFYWADWRKQVLPA